MRRRLFASVHGTEGRLWALLVLCVAALLPAAPARAVHGEAPLHGVLLCDGSAPLQATARIAVDGAERRVRLECDAAAAWIAEALVPLEDGAGAWEAELTVTARDGETRCAESGRRLPALATCDAGAGQVRLSVSLAPFPELPLRFTPAALSPAEREILFDTVWAMVDSYYVDPRFNGLDWEDLGATYRERALDAEDAEAFYAVLAELIAALDDDHSRLLPPWQALTETVAGGDGGTYEGIGFVGAYEPEALLVVYVYPGSPAERAGLRPRDRILTVDGEPVSAAAAGVRLDPGALAPAYALDGQPTGAPRDPLGIRGRAGSRVTLTVAGPGVRPEELGGGRGDREITIERELVVAELIPVATRLASHPAIGYLQIPTFSTDAMPGQVERSLSDLLDEGTLDGLVLDLRGNPGGHIVLLAQILGLFIDGEVATISGRHGDQAYAYPVEIEVRPLADELEGVELVVLVDRHTNSAAELAAAILQAEGRATVVGETSAGNVEWLLTSVLADGSVVSIANGRWALTDGPALEGRGVIPDLEVAADWTRYPAERDPFLSAAAAVLGQ